MWSVPDDEDTLAAEGLGQDAASGVLTFDQIIGAKGGQGGKGFAGIDLAFLGNGLDTRRPVDMMTDVVGPAGDRIDE